MINKAIEIPTFILKFGSHLAPNYYSSCGEHHDIHHLTRNFDPFWPTTMYDAKKRLMVENPINRYKSGSANINL